MRISVIRSLRSVGRAQPQFAFEKAKVFWEDPNPFVISEILELITGLPSPYLVKSLPLVRRVLSRAKSEQPEFRVDAAKALTLLEHALPEYPNEVFEETAEYLRQCFGERDHELAHGEYPLDQAFKLLSGYVLVHPQTNIHAVVRLLEERFRAFWSRWAKAGIPYDGMKHFSLIFTNVNYGPPSLDEDSMVEESLIAPFLEFAENNAGEATELAMSFADNTNAFARRAALHVALQLSLKGDSRGDDLIEKAIDAYINSHDYISVFQSAESLLIPLAAHNAPVAIRLLRKLYATGAGYLDSFEVAALLNLAETEIEARDLLQRILAGGSDYLLPQVIKGMERLAESDPGMFENMLRVVVDRYHDNPPAEIGSVLVDAATTLARSSWTRARPFFELSASSSQWALTSGVGQRLAEIAKTNPEAWVDVRDMMRRLARDPLPEVRQTAVMAVSQLTQLAGPFGLDLSERLSNDPDPLPAEDEQLLEGPVQDVITIQTVRGTVAFCVPHFAHVDEGRSWNLLAKLSTDMSAYVRTLAAQSLEAFSKDPKYLREILAILLSGGPKSAGLLGDESAWVRHRSLGLVFNQLRSNPESIDMLYSYIDKAIHDTDAHVRSEAVQLVVNAVAVTGELPFGKLLQQILNQGAAEERSELAHYVRQYMDRGGRNTFDVFSPILTKLVSDSDPEVRYRAALSLHKWCETHPDEVADWCRLLLETEASCPAVNRSAMAGHLISQTLQCLLPKHPEQAVKILVCIEKLPDRFQLNQILMATKDLPVEFRPRVRHVVEHLLKQGLPAAQQLLEAWEKPA
jgi:hypothetical protein